MAIAHLYEDNLLSFMLLPLIFATDAIKNWSMRLTLRLDAHRALVRKCKRTFVTNLLYQHSQYAPFDRPNKTDVMIISPGKSVTRGS